MLKSEEQRSMLPIISIAGMVHGSAVEKRHIAASLNEVCLKHGFFYIADHGINTTLISAILAASKRFFSLPLEKKLAVDKAHSLCNRGYEPLRGQALESGAPPDLKEGFYVGMDLPIDDPRVIAGLFNHGPNVWPIGFSPADLMSWRASLEEYFDEMMILGHTIMRALALALRLPEGYFDDFCHEPMATLRLLHYPPQPANPLPNEKGCGAHTDFGAITILLQDNSGGLQVSDGQNNWIDAPPIADTLIINLGDLVARWTNDRYRSTLHRVINISGAERYSVPFFYTGRADYKITCLEPCLLPGDRPKYPPTTTIGHLQEMYDRTYGRA